MKKKVLFVSEALWIGGIETALINLLNHLDYERFDVTLLIAKASLELADRATPKCRLLIADREKTYSFEKPYKFAWLFHLTEKTDRPSKLHRALMWMTPLIRWIENRLYICYVRKNMRREHFDTAVIYSDRTAEMTVRGIRADRYLMYYHHGAMRREYHDEIGYRRSEKVITVSNGIASLLAEFRPKYKKKMVAINNLIDLQDVREKCRETVPITFEKSDFNIVTCGRVSREKGMDIALDACAMLIRDGKTDIRWWIVGGGPMEDEIRSQAEQLGISDRFHVLGMQANPYPFIAMADLYVQPSRFEGHSVTVMEARVLGKAIVATENAAAEQLTDREDGMLCKANAEAIAHTVSELYQNERLRSELGERAGRYLFEKDNYDNLQMLQALL